MESTVESAARQCKSPVFCTGQNLRALVTCSGLSIRAAAGDGLLVAEYPAQRSITARSCLGTVIREAADGSFCRRDNFSFVSIFQNPGKMGSLLD